MQMQDRGRPHLEPLALAQGLRQGERRGTGLQLLPHEAGDGCRDGGCPQQQLGDALRHLGLDPATPMLAEIDVPGLAQANDDHVRARLLQLTDDVLLPLAIEPPAEASGTGLPMGQGRTLSVAPVTALGLEHATQRVAVPDRAQPLGLRIATTEQPPDHLVGDADEARRIVGDEIGHGERVLAAVEAAAQAARPECADRQGLDRRRVAPEPLRGLEHVEDTVGTLGGMAVGLRAGILVDGGDPRLEFRLDGGADLVDIWRRGLLERREQRGGGMFALAVD